MSYRRDRKRNRRLSAFAILFFAFLLCGWETAPSAAQQPQHAGPSASPALSTSLTISMDDGKNLVLSSGDLAALPHKTVVVLNDHRNVKESYSGVPLSTLLAKIGVPQGDQVKGGLFMIGVVAGGTDGYKVLYSLAEIDSSIHVGDVLVADTVDGHDLGAEGAFKLVSTEEKRPARWVRNLTAISVIHVKP
jgi:hypothetical protein